MGRRTLASAAFAFVAAAVVACGAPQSAPTRAATDRPRDGATTPSASDAGDASTTAAANPSTASIGWPDFPDAAAHDEMMARWKAEQEAQPPPPPVDPAAQAAAERAAREEQAKADACRARGNVMDAGTCRKPFPDAGRACHDSSECRGVCVMTKVTRLGDGKVRLDGQCSQIPMPYGCYATIKGTPGKKGVVRENQIPGEDCVD